ncbi:unnamed protein product [Prunus armeniaca]|uniref:EamA domain-containing protein n=1 Tax=Prunus armeniaca TaxID=36596 RepID=A0A6J5UKV6_PRUAR|nr:unnamed protein product [Prunus armeniaca]
MGKAQDLQPHIIVKGGEEVNTLEFEKITHQATISQLKDFTWCVRMAIYTLFVLSGQSAAVLLGRLYYKFIRVLLTISSTLLVFQAGDSADDPIGGSKTKYVIGFLCTVGASAGYGLVLSLTQLVFREVIRKETFAVILDMIVYQSLVATCAVLVGLFASGEWRGLRKEMEGFELGKVSYVMNLTWSAIIWQLYAIGTVGLIFEASSLFSNAISVVGLPVVPVLAVIFFHDKMDGIKAMAMVLGTWGFISYVYQHYLDDRKSKTGSNNATGEVSKAFPLENING